MEIGSLFVTLGLKGANKTNNDLKKTQDNIMGISKKSLGAIAALAGVSLGLSAIYQRATQAGVGLSKFSNYTGKSSKELQKWQYVAMNAGVAAAEVENTFRSIGQIAGDFSLTGNLPAELNRIAQVVGGIDLSKLDDADYMLRKIQQFLQSGAESQNTLNTIASGIVSPEMIQFLNTNKKDPSMVPDGAIMSDGTSKALLQSKVEMDKFIKDIEVRFARLFVKIGPKVLPQLKELAVQVVNLTEALVTFLSNNKAFEMIGSLVKALTMALKGNVWGAAEEMAKYGDMQASVMRGGWYEDIVKGSVLPVTRPAAALADAAISGTINMVQNLNFSGRDDSYARGLAKIAEKSAYKGVTDAHKKATSQAK